MDLDTLHKRKELIEDNIEMSQMDVDECFERYIQTGDPFAMSEYREAFIRLSADRSALERVEKRIKRAEQE